MRYSMPNFPCDFEIPDDWIAECGIAGFVPGAPAFSTPDAATLVPLKAIVPPLRFNEYPIDWCGFDRARLARLLRRIASREAIDPVPTIQLPASDRYVQLSYTHCIRDGYHRFYASVIAGFECLPVTSATLDELIAESKRLGWRT